MSGTGRESRGERPDGRTPDPRHDGQGTPNPGPAGSGKSGSGKSGPGEPGSGESDSSTGSPRPAEGEGLEQVGARSRGSVSGPRLEGTGSTSGASPPGARPRHSRHEARLRERGGWTEVLRIPSLLFGGVARLRAWLYDRGWLPSHRVEAPVVSVGNLSVGGTGKTPMVLLVARALEALGRRPGLLSRGYGAQAGGSGHNDEGAQIVELMPDLIHVQDADRVRGARELLRRGVDVVILDDGFQHRRLKRDLELVLVDATRPWGLPAPTGGGSPVRAMLPRGFLREPPGSLGRAHGIVITRADQVEEGKLAELRSELEAWAPGVAILEAVHHPLAIRDDEGWRLSVDGLEGRDLELVSGIGNPESFEETVRAAGGHVVGHRIFPDHHEYRASDLLGLGGSGKTVLTTQKDAVKLRAFLPRVWVLEIDLRLRRGAPVLQAMLESLPQSRAEIQRRSLHEGLHG